MKSILDELTTDLERAESLQNQLISIATGGPGLPYEYQELRRYFVDSPVYNSLIPSFIKTNRNTDQFWQFIKYEFSTYADRRQYIWGEFQELMDYLEGKNKAPADEDISDVLKRFDENGVHNVWIKALERRHADPEGAITSARTLLETVCKHILDDMQ
ncbi:abortive phage resistance protein, partial [Klebsiella quasipneumoniae subsp. similipneumoniae]